MIVKAMKICEQALIVFPEPLQSSIRITPVTGGTTVCLVIPKASHFRLPNSSSFHSTLNQVTTFRSAVSEYLLTVSRKATFLHGCCHPGSNVGWQHSVYVGYSRIRRHLAVFHLRT